MSNISDLTVFAVVEDYLIRRSAEEKRDNSHFHSSEFHGCKRKIAFKYYIEKGLLGGKLVVDKPNAQLQRVFGNGHHVHYRWTNYLQDTRCARNMLKGFWKCKNSYAHENAWKINSSLKPSECQPKIFGMENKLGILCPIQACEC